MNDETLGQKAREILAGWEFLGTHMNPGEPEFEAYTGAIVKLAIEYAEERVNAYKTETATGRFFGYGDKLHVDVTANGKLIRATYTLHKDGSFRLTDRTEEEA